MAVTITRDQLAVALRLATSDGTAAALPVGQLETVARILAVSTAMVEGYASAPDAIHNEAVIRLSGYLYDVAPGAPSSVKSPLLHSQAASLLTRYRPRRLGVGGGTPGAPSTRAPSTPTAQPSVGGPGTDQVARDAAAAAQATATAAAILARSKVDAAGAAAAARTITADWAEVDNTDLPPASKSRLATSTERGAVEGVGTNALVDVGTGSDVRGWSIAHIFRAITNRVKSWARTNSTDLIPPEALFGPNPARDRAVVVDPSGNFQLVTGGTAGGTSPAAPTPGVYIRIANPASYGTDNRLGVESESWRDYEWLVCIYRRTQDAMGYPFAVLVQLLDTETTIEVPLEQNARLKLMATADSDVIQFSELAGITGSPAASDTLEVWGYTPPRMPAVQAGGGDTAVIADSDIAVTAATWATTGLQIPTSGYVMGEVYQESSTGGGAFANPTFAFGAAELRGLDPGTVGNADGQSVIGRSNTRFAVNSNILLGRDSGNVLLIRLSVANTRNSQLNYVLAVGTPS